MENANIYSVYTVADFLELMNLSDYQKSNSFHILKFEDHYSEMPRDVSLRSLGYFEVTLVTKSIKNATKIAVDHINFTAQSSSLTVVAPGQDTHINVQGSSSDDVTGYLIVFTPDFLNEVLSTYNIIQRFPYFNLRFSPIHSIDEEKTKKLQELFELVFEKFHLMKVGDEELLNAYFNVLLLEVQEILKLEKIKGNRPSQIVYNFENLVKKTSHKHQKLEYYAEKLFISTTYLSECVRKVTGYSAKKIIDQYILMEAKSLLDYSDHDISSISTMLGFDEVSNFIAYFKKAIGTTPLLYRRKSETKNNGSG